MRRFSPSLEVRELHSFMMSLARSVICALFDALTSSIPSRMTLAEQGPTLSTLSTAAAMSAAVLTSVDIGIRIAPYVLSFLDSRLISIRPTFHVFWSSFRFISGPKRPSVWPKIAPIKSAFSTTPSTSNLSLTRYFTIAESGNCFHSTRVVSC